MIVEDDDEDWDHEGLMKAEEAEASGLRGKMRTLQEKFCFASVKAPADMLAVIALAK